MGRKTVLAVRCAAAALVITLVVAFHVQPGNVLRLSAQTYYIPFPFPVPFYGGGSPFATYPSFGAQVYQPAPVTQVVNASNYAMPVGTVAYVGGPSYSSPLPGTPVVTLAAGSAAQALPPGCTEVHLDGGAGLTVDKLLAKISPAGNVQDISIVDSTGAAKYVYMTSGSGTPPATPIGSGQLVLVICIVGFNTTISAP